MVTTQTTDRSDVANFDEEIRTLSEMLGELSEEEQREVAVEVRGRLALRVARELLAARAIEPQVARLSRRVQRLESAVLTQVESQRKTAEKS